MASLSSGCICSCTHPFLSICMNLYIYLFVLALNFHLVKRHSQRPKKFQLSGQQTFTRKNFPDEVSELFLRHVPKLR